MVGEDNVKVIGFIFVMLGLVLIGHTNNWGLAIGLFFMLTGIAIRLEQNL